MSGSITYDLILTKIMRNDSYRFQRFLKMIMVPFMIGLLTYIVVVALQPNQNNNNDRHVIKGIKSTPKSIFANAWMIPSSSFEYSIPYRHQHQYHTYHPTRIIMKTKNTNRIDDDGIDIDIEKNSVASERKNQLNHQMEQELSKCHHDKKNNNHRRLLIKKMTIFSNTLFIGNIYTSLPSYGGEIGEKITKIVTESDLGISVRRSVIQGAQIFDTMDQKIESISDQYQLGTERKKAQLRKDEWINSRNIPPPLQPLNQVIATKVIDITDHVFTSITDISYQTLQKQINKVSLLVSPSFIRSGMITSNDIEQLGINKNNKGISSMIQNPSQFNYASYIHWKAYLDIIIEKKINFKTFQSKFETLLGQELFTLLMLQSSTSSVSSKQQQKQKQIRQSDTSTTTPTNTDNIANNITTTNNNTIILLNTFDMIDKILQQMISYGFLSQYDQSKIDNETMNDWSNYDESLLSDITWNIAIDDDITLQSQILLQEQGYRLYPNYMKYILYGIIEQQKQKQSSNNSRSLFVTTIDDYYLDTDYNPDPNQYEVKQVLLNIHLENV